VPKDWPRRPRAPTASGARGRPTLQSPPVWVAWPHAAGSDCRCRAAASARRVLRGPLALAGRAERGARHAARPAL